MCCSGRRGGGGGGGGGVGRGEGLWSGGVALAAVWLSAEAPCDGGDKNNKVIKA